MPCSSKNRLPPSLSQEIVRVQYCCSQTGKGCHQFCHQFGHRFGHHFSPRNLLTRIVTLDRDAEKSWICLQRAGEGGSKRFHDVLRTGRPEGDSGNIGSISGANRLRTTFDRPRCVIHLLPLLLYSVEYCLFYLKAQKSTTLLFYQLPIHQHTPFSAFPHSPATVTISDL